MSEQDQVVCVNDNWGHDDLWALSSVSQPWPMVGQVFTVSGFVDESCGCGNVHGFYRFSEYPQNIIFACVMFKPVQKPGTETGFSMLLDAARKVELPVEVRPVKAPEPVSRLILEGAALLALMRHNAKGWPQR